MQKFQNNIQDQFGNAVTGAQVEVRNVVGGALSTLFSDDAVTPLANPFTAQDGAEFFFYASNSRYDVFISGPVTDSMLDVILFDVADAAPGFDTAANYTLTGDWTWQGATIFDNAADDVDLEPNVNIFLRNSADTSSTFIQNLGSALQFGVAGGDFGSQVFEVGSSFLKLQLNRSLFFDEKAAQGTPVLGDGEYWVRNLAPNRPYFTDDLGNDFDLTSAAAPFILLDSEEIRFGTGNDFQMFSDGADLFIQASAGFPSFGVLGGMDLRAYGPSDTHYIGLDSNGTNGGIFVSSGHINVLDDFSLTDNTEINFGASDDLRIFSNGTNAEMVGLTNGVLLISGFDQVRISESLGMNEVAAPDGNVAGVGQFWVRSSAPNRPTFRDDTGIDQLLDPSISEIISVVASRVGILSDKGKTVAFTGATAAQTMTIPANGSVAFQIGTLLAWDNSGSVSFSIAITTDTLIFADDNTTGTRTLAAGGAAVAQKVGATTWKIAGAGLT